MLRPKRAWSASFRMVPHVHLYNACVYDCAVENFGFGKSLSALRASESMMKRVTRLTQLHDSVAELKAEFDSNKTLSPELLVSSNLSLASPT